MYLINGKEVKKEEFNIPVENLAIWRGDGIFEAIAIHNGYLFAIDKHMERFATVSYTHLTLPTKRIV